MRVSKYGVQLFKQIKYPLQVTSQIRSSKVVTFIRIKFVKCMVKKGVHVITISMATAERRMCVKDSTLL